MGLCRTVSEIDGDFCRKSQNFPTPCILCPRWRGFPWNWVSVLGVKELEWRGYRAEKEVWRYLIWIQCINVTDRRTDGQTDTGRLQRPRLRIASCGNKSEAANRWRNGYFCLVLHVQNDAVFALVELLEVGADFLYVGHRNQLQQQHWTSALSTAWRTISMPNITSQPVISSSGPVWTQGL